VSDLYSRVIPKMSVANKCDFLKTTVFWLSLISHGSQSTRINFQIQQGKLFLLNSKICHTCAEAMNPVQLGLVLAALSVLGPFPGANFCHSKEWCSPVFITVHSNLNNVSNLTHDAQYLRSC